MYRYTYMGHFTFLSPHEIQLSSVLSCWRDASHQSRRTCCVHLNTSSLASRDARVVGLEIPVCTHMHHIYGGTRLLMTFQRGETEEN